MEVIEVTLKSHNRHKFYPGHVVKITSGLFSGQVGVVQMLGTSGQEKMANVKCPNLCDGIWLSLNQLKHHS